MGKHLSAKKTYLLQVAARLFLSQGYEKTGMRQIAREAGVSIGLATYHFGSKKDMAVAIVGELFEQISLCVQRYVDRREDPILYSVLLVNLNYLVFSSPRYLAFYRDMLRDDILLEVIVHSGTETYRSIRDRYCPGMSDEKVEDMSWYGNYISISMERTLVLHIQEQELWGEPIPDLIVNSYMGLWKFPNAEQVLQEKKAEGRKLAERIVRENPDLLENTEIAGSWCSGAN